MTAGILANQTGGPVMTDGDADGVVNGYTTDAMITLSTTPAGSGHVWGLARPQGATVRSQLSDTSGASVTFTPDVEGIYLATCTVAGPVSYTLQIQVVSVQPTDITGGQRFLGRISASIATPVALSETFYYDSSVNRYRSKLPDGTTREVEAGGSLNTSTLFVDNAAGNYNADGSAARPVTAPGLARIVNSRTFDPTLSTLTINVGAGALTDQLTGQFHLAGPTLVTVQGTMGSPLRSGTLSAYTAFTAGSVYASLQDSGFDFTPYIDKRIRITSGAQIGACAHIDSVSGATCFVGQFMKVTSSGVSTVNPAPGDTYVVEDYSTTLQQFGMEVLGAGGSGSFTFRDFGVVGASGARGSLVGPHRHYASAQIFGCGFDLSLGMNLTGSFTMASCRTRGAGVLSFLGRTATRLFAHLAHSQMQVSDGHYQIGQNNLHQGSTASVILGTDSAIEDLGMRAFKGVGGTFCLQVNAEGRYFQINSNGKLWGTGNTSTNYVVVGSDGSFIYNSLPAITGSTNDILVGVTQRLFSNLPYTDPTTNARAVAGP